MGQHCVPGDGRWLGVPYEHEALALHKQQSEPSILWDDYVPVSLGYRKNSVGVGKEGTFGEGRNASTLGGEEEVGNSPGFQEERVLPLNLGPSAEDL